MTYVDSFSQFLRGLPAPRVDIDSHPDQVNPSETFAEKSRQLAVAIADRSEKRPQQVDVVGAGQE